MADETFPSTSHAGCFPDKYQGEFGEAFSNFEEVNKQPLRLLPEFHLPRRYDFVTKKQLDAMIKVIQPPPVLDDSWSSDTDRRLFLWEAFSKEFPKSDGYFVLSAVGFNSRKDKAVVNVALYCGYLCALTTDYLLEKRQGRWTILPVESACTGVS
ncbi:MAG: hypothetical protein ROO76_07005 [Terriglobia bacterium]|nr:hypothetical protein [Terriglobia bacterium]